MPAAVNVHLRQAAGRRDLRLSLGVLTRAALILTALGPGLAASLVIFPLPAASGAYRMAANTAFAVRVPSERRAQAFGIVSMAVIAGQGAGFPAAGPARRWLLQPWSSRPGAEPAR